MIRASLVCGILFAMSVLVLAYMSTASSSMALYMVVTFTNGFVTGASLNYTLVHLLHLTSKDIHVIVTPLVAMFRGFAGSFGSAIGGGIFSRSLRTSLEHGFADRGLTGRDDLIRKLIGSPALVAHLTGDDHEVAQSGYVSAMRTLFIAGAALALCVTVIQAGTGWKAADGKENKNDIVAPASEPQEHP